MAVAAGQTISARNVYAAEATQNTRETPDHHIEFVSYSPGSAPIKRIPHGGHRGGRRTRSQGTQGNKLWTYSKTINMVPESLAEWTLGTMCLSAVTAGAGPYTHTGSPDALTSFTDQFVFHDYAGTETVHEYLGSVCTGGSITVNASGDGAPIQIQTNHAAFDMDDTQSAIAAAYPTVTARWTSVEASATIAAAAAPFTNLTLNWDNGVGTDVKAQSTNAGLADIRQEQLTEWGGSIETDYDSNVRHDYWYDQVTNAVVVTIDDGTASLVFTMNGTWIGDPAGIPESGPLRQPLSWICESDTSDAAFLTAVFTNADSAA